MTLRGRLRLAALAACLLPSAVAAAGTVDERRLPYAPTAAEEAAEQALRRAPIDAFVPHVFTAPDGSPVRYRLLSPAAPADGGPLPLVLVLPTSGGIGTDNRNQMRAPLGVSWAEPAIAARYPAYVAVVQVTTRSAVYGPDADGMQASRPGASLPPLLALADDLAGRLPVDPARIYLVGFSMGASAALNAVVLAPRRFAGVVAFSGVPPRRSLAASVAPVPVMLIHGTADRNNPLDADRAWAGALAAAGADPILVVQDGLGHKVAPGMFLARDWREWLFAQRRAD
ncbi:dienelactone hydrolase family protein [Inquilinus sp.]|uniref:carboxylesterase family protein n=1 Tax=Inquilinus sp. TaxID=1932117 RepID=UPI0037851BA7